MKGYIENGRPESQSFSEGFIDSHSGDPRCPHCGTTIYSGRSAYGRPRDGSAIVQFENPPKDQKELSVLEILFEPLVFWFGFFWAFFGPLIDFRDLNNEDVIKDIIKAV